MDDAPSTGRHFISSEQFWALVDKRRPTTSEEGNTVYIVAASTAEISKYLGTGDTVYVTDVGDVAFYYEGAHRIVAEVKPPKAATRIEPDRYAGLRAKGLA